MNLESAILLGATRRQTLLAGGPGSGRRPNHTLPAKISEDEARRTALTKEYAKKRIAEPETPEERKSRLRDEDLDTPDEEAPVHIHDPKKEGGHFKSLTEWRKALPMAAGGQGSGRHSEGNLHPIHKPFHSALVKNGFSYKGTKDGVSTYHHPQTGMVEVKPGGATMTPEKEVDEKIARRIERMKQRRSDAT